MWIGGRNALESFIYHLPSVMGKGVAKRGSTVISDSLDWLALDAMTFFMTKSRIRDEQITKK